jgi:hypothetical protein
MDELLIAGVYSLLIPGTCGSQADSGRGVIAVSTEADKVYQPKFSISIVRNDGNGTRKVDTYYVEGRSVVDEMATFLEKQATDFLHAKSRVVKLSPTENSKEQECKISSRTEP